MARKWLAVALVAMALCAAYADEEAQFREEQARIVDSFLDGLGAETATALKAKLNSVGIASAKPSHHKYKHGDVEVGYRMLSIALLQAEELEFTHEDNAMRVAAMEPSKHKHKGGKDGDVAVADLDLLYIVASDCEGDNCKPWAFAGKSVFRSNRDTTIVEEDDTLSVEGPLVSGGRWETVGQVGEEFGKRGAINLFASFGEVPNGLVLDFSEGALVTVTASLTIDKDGIVTEREKDWTACGTLKGLEKVPFCKLTGAFCGDKLAVDLYDKDDDVTIDPPGELLACLEAYVDALRP